MQRDRHLGGSLDWLGGEAAAPCQPVFTPRCGNGLILASAFPAILVFAQDMLPRRTGLISGLFFGVAFGFGGLGAILLGAVAEHFGIDAAFEACSYLPLLGLAVLFLPALPPANR